MRKTLRVERIDLGGVGPSILETAQIPVLAVYVSRDGQTFGPFSWEELWGHFQAGSVLGTDLAWYEGQSEWRFVQQLFVPAPIDAPMPVAVVVPPAGASSEASHLGPLSYAGVSEGHRLADPSALSASAPVTAERPITDPKPGKVSKPKAKGRIAGIRWQDIELPGWLKYAAPVAVVVLVYLVFGGTKWGPIPRDTQIIGQAVRNHLVKRDITPTNPKGDLELADYQKATDLKITGKALKDLKELSKCTGVVTLNLSSNEITDLSPLAGMSKLEELYLSNNKINDFKPLEKLGSLKFLIIEGNPGASKSAEDALKRALPGITFSKKPPE